MTLIKSISGIRGTIGGGQGDNLTPIDVVKFSAAYAEWLKKDRPNKKLSVVIGRDARISGEMVNSLIEGTLMGCGVDIIGLGLCSTPGVEVAVTDYEADGGIIITASHNPKQWNALKMLNHKGEFLSAADGAEILEYSESDDLIFPEVDDLGKVLCRESYDEKHIEAVLALPLVDVDAVKSKGYKVVVDGVNSVGGVVIPKLLREMGVEVVELNCTPDGNFAHDPEPLAENLTEISKLVVETKADLGVVVDPDVDRLALINEDGTMFGEEYTLVAVADYVLSQTKGNSVSNLSSTRALRDITKRHGGSYSAAAVGEVNVVEEMKKREAVIGGEGNGGIIYPALHYGRDSLVGVALFLTHLAKSDITISELRASYPDYYMSKKRVDLTPEIDVDEILKQMEQKYAKEEVNTIDGVKIDFPDSWVHLRKSNTEPIIRIYSEAGDMESAERLADKIIAEIRELI